MSPEEKDLPVHAAQISKDGDFLQLDKDGAVIERHRRWSFTLIGMSDGTVVVQGIEGSFIEPGQRVTGTFIEATKPPK